MSRYEPMEHYGKMRVVSHVRSITCEADDCQAPPQFQVQFEDGYWSNFCLEHKPKLKE